jgi:hypothetical protein
MNKIIEQLKKDGFNVEVKHRRYTLGDWYIVKMATHEKRRELSNYFKNPINDENIDLDSVAKENVKQPIENSQIVNKFDISPRAGETVVELEKDGKKAFGKAICSWFDNFNRRIGVSIALGNAIKSFELNEGI